MAGSRLPSAAVLFHASVRKMHNRRGQILRKATRRCRGWRQTCLCSVSPENIRQKCLRACLCGPQLGSVFTEGAHGKQWITKDREV